MNSFFDFLFIHFIFRCVYTLKWSCTNHVYKCCMVRMSNKHLSTQAQYRWLWKIPNSPNALWVAWIEFRPYELTNAQYHTNLHLRHTHSCTHSNFTRTHTLLWKERMSTSFPVWIFEIVNKLSIFKRRTILNSKLFRTITNHNIYKM